MSAQENKAMLRRLVDEGLNQGNMSVVDELFAPKLAGQVKQGFTEFRSGFPDWHEEIVEIVAEEDKVVGRFKCSGTHRQTRT